MLHPCGWFSFQQLSLLLKGRQQKAEGNRGSPCALVLHCLVLTSSLLPKTRQASERPEMEVRTNLFKKTKPKTNKKHKPRLVQRRGRRRLQALEAFVRTVPKKLALYNRERGSRRGPHPEPSPASAVGSRAVPTKVHQHPGTCPPSPSTTIKVQQGRRGEGPAPTNTTPAQAVKCEAPVPVAQCSSLTLASYVVALRTSKERALATTAPSNLTHSHRGTARAKCSL